MKRQEIVNRIILLFKRINKQSGFYTDCGNKVFLWRRTTLKDEELPCIALWDTLAEKIDADVPIGYQGYDLNIGVVAYFEPDTPASEARKALADIVNAIGFDPMLSGLANGMVDIVSHELGLDTKANAAGMARVQLVVPYISPLYKI